MEPVTNTEFEGLVRQRYPRAYTAAGHVIWDRLSNWEAYRQAGRLDAENFHGFLGWGWQDAWRRIEAKERAWEGRIRQLYPMPPEPTTLFGCTFTTWDEGVTLAKLRSIPFPWEAVYLALKDRHLFFPMENIPTGTLRTYIAVLQGTIQGSVPSTDLVSSLQELVRRREEPLCNGGL